MSFTNFGTGSSHSFGGTYLELVPNERLRYTDKFDDPNLPGEMITTVMLKPVMCGTEVNITQEGIPVIGGSTGGETARRIRFWPSTGKAQQRVMGQSEAHVFARELSIAATPVAPPADDVEFF